MPLPQKKLIPGILLLLVIAALAAPPLWWSVGNPPVIDLTAAENNQGPANIGQAKHMTKSALEALHTVLPDIATQIETDLTTGPNPILDFTVPDPKTPAWLEKQKAPLLIGQLKALSAPFYETLHSSSPSWLEEQLIANQTKDTADTANFFPWSSNTSDDANRAIANIGQLKAVFSLRFNERSGSDALPDLWKYQIINASDTDTITTLGHVTEQGDFDNDGVDNLTEYQLGTDPTVFSNSPIQWTSLLDVTLDNPVPASSSLTKTSGGDYWNAGARSTRVLGGDGAIFASSSDGDTYTMFGFSHVHLNHGYRQISYAVYFHNGTNIVVYENGKHKGLKTTYLPTDILEVRRTGTTVEYLKNGTVFYTSLTPSTRPVYAVTSINRQDSALSNTTSHGFTDSLDTDLDGLIDSYEQQIVDVDPSDAINTITDVSGFGDFDRDGLSDVAEYALLTDPINSPNQGWIPVEWSNLIGTASSQPADHFGTSLTKTEINAWGNADATSATALPGDGGVSCRASSLTTTSFIALNLSNDSQSFSDLDYGIYFHPTRELLIYEKGIYKANIGIYGLNDSLSIEREGDTIYYKRNGKVFYTSEAKSTQPLFIDSALHATGDTLTHCLMRGFPHSGDLDGDGIPYNDEYALISQALPTLATTIADISAVSDLDGDGITDQLELANGSDPLDLYSGGGNVAWPSDAIVAWYRMDTHPPESDSSGKLTSWKNSVAPNDPNALHIIPSPTTNSPTILSGTPFSVMQSEENEVSYTTNNGTDYLTAETNGFTILGHFKPTSDSSKAFAGILNNEHYLNSGFRLARRKDQSGKLNWWSSQSGGDLSLWSNEGLALGSPYQFTLSHHPATTQYSSLHINGQYQSSAADAVIKSNTRSVYLQFIGGAGGQPADWNELILAGRQLTNAEQTLVQDYLLAKHQNTGPLAGDLDNDTIPDWQEVELGGSEAINDNPIDPSLDTDLDGLPDVWEMANGLDPEDDGMVNSAHGAKGDLDGDGFSNIQEFYAESDPQDLASKPKGMISANFYHSTALTADGRIWTWGHNGYGQLGDGTTSGRNTPVPLSVSAEMGTIVSIDTGNEFTIALDENGVMWGWGKNYNHQIAKDPTYLYKTPVKIALSAPVARFACGKEHVLALDRSGKIWAWGNNNYGQLGLGHTNEVFGAVEITRSVGMQSIQHIAAGGDSSYAVDIAGKMWSWGYNGSGQLGDGSSTNQSVPVSIDISNGVPAIRTIVSSHNHVIAAGIDDSIWSWGYNGYGQLGHGNWTSNNKPVKVTSGLTEAHSLSASLRHSIGLSLSGEVWGWGWNGHGQLGTNSTSSSNAPVQTTTITDWSNISRITSGDHHNVALKDDGSLWTWGLNSNGQLGLGDNTQRLVPTRIGSLKLSDDDSDLDGLPDSWERFYFTGSLSQTGGDVAVIGGVSNLVAYTHFLNPLLADNDNDGISDADEISTLDLDPLDWTDATGDLDGDRIPNLWEQEMGSEMNAKSSVPSNIVTVSAGESIQSAINAIPANSSDPTWAIIKVDPGIYLGNITLPNNKRILLIPSTDSGIPEIRGTTSSSALTINGESVVDGFRITHAKDASGSGVYSSLPSNGRTARIVNCLIHGHNGFNGIGIHLNSGRLVIAHCTVFQNSSTRFSANGLYVNSSTRTLLLNSIFHNTQGAASLEIYAQGVTESRHTMVSDGSIEGGPIGDPLLNPFGLLTKASPARARGTVETLLSRDIQGDPRGSLPDIGADQFIDDDDDGLPNWLELLGVTSSAADNDNDGLSNLEEYEITGTDPLVADVDGDNLNDGAEITAGLDPFDPDSDADGMPDGWEVDYDLDPLDDRDALSDKDGDRIPNLWEYKRGTIPANDPDVNNSTSGLDSHPAPDWIVNPALAGTGNYVATIRQAIANAPTDTTDAAFYAVIEVSSGVYEKNVKIPYNKKITLLGELGNLLPEIRSAANSSYSLDILGEAFIDGFRVTRSKDNDDIPYNGNSGVRVHTLSGTGQVSLSNLLIHGHRSRDGAGIYCNNGRLRLLHCTIYDTGAANSGNGIYFSSESLDIQNCIIRGDSGTASQQIHNGSSGIVSISGSFILGGEFGGNATDPMLTSGGWLRKGSAAIDSGLSLQVLRDVHNELRTDSPDAGADEFVSSDLDSLADAWEEIYFGNLTQGDNDDSDTGGADGLNNLGEYLAGTDPTNRDTDFDEYIDGLELAHSPQATDPLNPDTDQDDMKDGVEVTYFLDPLSAADKMLDGDLDRVPNVYEVVKGHSPIDENDTPVADIIVDRATGGVSNSDNIYRTIQQALNASPDADVVDLPYTIISVSPGEYEESISIYSDRRVALLAEQAFQETVINYTASRSVIYFYAKDSVVDGFVLSRKDATKPRSTVYSSLSSADSAYFKNCILRDGYAGRGGAIYVSEGTLFGEHLTLSRNKALYEGNAAYVKSGETLDLKNSIVWGNSGDASESIKSYGTVSISDTWVEGGEHGGNSSNPQITPFGYLNSTSPAIDACDPVLKIAQDIQGDDRDLTPDAGADEFISSDLDSLPDLWEMTYFGNLTQGDNDDSDTGGADGLNNLGEYLAGTDPTNRDTDFDEYIDGLELAHSPQATDPLNPDTDQDDMKDGVEVTYFLDPLSAADKMLDGDLDRVPNVYEVVKGHSPIDENDTPVADIIVDRATGGVSNSDNIYRTIQQALNASPDADVVDLPYTIISVLPGEYEESILIRSDRRVALLAEQAFQETVINYTASGSVIYSYAKDSVVDGFVLSRKDATSAYSTIRFNLLSSADSAYFKNCILRDGYARDGGALYLANGTFIGEHLTFTRNKALYEGNAAYVQSGGMLLDLKKSIVWGNSGNASESIKSYGTVSISDTWVEGGEHGANNANPRITPSGYLANNSSARDACDPVMGITRDIHGEVRDATPDAGADEFYSADGDSIPDFWEMAHFGDLTKASNDDNDAPSSDGLTNYYEYLLGFDPVNSDSWSNGDGDLYNAVFGLINSPWYPAEWLLDDDNDSLTNGLELYYETDPNEPDTNGDSLTDYLAIHLGISATSNDTDSDGISNAQEILNGTSPLFADTDRDGVNDNLDPFPLDPSISSLPDPEPSDNAAPAISLQRPSNAVLQP